MARAVVFALALGLGACGSAGPGRQTTPPLMNSADPQMMQITTPAENPDTDRDGIVDDRDRCPTAIEDHDGFEDDDGCPESDNDGDGIADQADKCPNEPEVYNSVGDADGCPD